MAARPLAGPPERLPRYLGLRKVGRNLNNELVKHLKEDGLEHGTRSIDQSSWWRGRMSSDESVITIAQAGGH